uniref:Multidrug efflux pump subunit AcrB n=1 Tax=Candidatus Kentrum eta TaxID=2126337 RepID=A0A450UYU4_9GAMM|nr:MAG: Multidrug efflux pump subunit AcrB [Candidatus Kentron sp. H]VFJ91228.1 MAG: Multidrug efflux pump subunit AcrB [Candidatus Kentron sp. H]VFJ97701.1 MAG: Multidrug efflux pump subunit AcrB [Candidatus Kentron sp. H]
MIEWFIRNGVAANLLMVLILALGIQAVAMRIPLEVFPDIDLDVVTVGMTHRGATPVEVEEGIVTRMEEAISDLIGIDKLISTASEGSARLRIEVADGHDPRGVLDDVKNRIDAINTFPTDAERPVYGVVQRRREVISVVVSADLPETALRTLGERTRDDLLALPGVTQVDLTGVRDHEIAIEVSQHTLERFGIGFDDVVAAVRNASKDYPAGSLKTRRGEILLRTRGQAYTGEDFARIVLITRPDGTYLTLADIAEIKDGFQEDPLFTRFNGNRAVLLEVYRTGNQSAITLARDVRHYMENARKTLPPGVKMDYWRDRSRIIELRLNTLASSAIQGGILIFLLLTLFLRLSVAVWVCVGIPVSFMGALALLPELGVTLNIISLFGFILVLGIVVDDAIVTGENIHSHMKRGEDPILAAIGGTREVAVPVTFGVLTTMAAFVPLLFVEGRRGAIFGQIPMVVIPVLIFSLIESKLILPSHLSHTRMGMGKPAGRFTTVQRRIADGLERGIRRFYRPLLARALDHRLLTLALFIGVSFFLSSFVLSGRYGFTFLPRVQSEVARASLVMPTGTPVEITGRHVSHILAVADRLREKYRDPASGESVIRNSLFQVGWSSSLGFMESAGGGGSHKGQVILELVPPEERALTVTTSELVREWRQGIGRIPGARELTFRAEIGRAGDPVDIQLVGDDFADLTAAAEEVKERLAEYPGVFDIRDSFDTGREEIKLRLRPEAELLGLSVSDLGNQVRQAFFGAEAQRIQRGRDDVRVMVRYPLAERRSEENLARMRIRTPDGVEVPFSAVADVTVGDGFSTIRRVDRHRAVNVTADINKEEININQITHDLGPFLADLGRRWPGVRYTLEGELREQRESFGSLMTGIALVLFVIYALLAIPFRSYAQPIIVMGVIPFSLVGALLGHMIMGMNLSIMSVWGLLALIGVVVNDSLVLVDYINRRRREGVETMAAVVMAGAARFRPILLTSLTTFAGLMPLIFDKSTQAQFLIPMAVSLGFGILYATLLTLFLAPVGYLLLEDARGGFRWGAPSERVIENRTS